jgi:hypothetical protein
MMASCICAAKRADVAVTSQGDDTCVVRGLLMQPTKVFTVTRDHGTPQDSSMGKNLRILDALVCPTCFMGGEHVMP